MLIRMTNKTTRQGRKEKEERKNDRIENEEDQVLSQVFIIVEWGELEQKFSDYNTYLTYNRKGDDSLNFCLNSHQCPNSPYSTVSEIFILRLALNR